MALVRRSVISNDGIKVTHETEAPAPTEHVTRVTYAPDPVRVATPLIVSPYCPPNPMSIMPSRTDVPQYATSGMVNGTHYTTQGWSGYSSPQQEARAISLQLINPLKLPFGAARPGQTQFSIMGQWYTAPNLQAAQQLQRRVMAGGRSVRRRY